MAIDKVNKFLQKNLVFFFLTAYSHTWLVQDI